MKAPTIGFLVSGGMFLAALCLLPVETPAYGGGREGKLSAGEMAQIYGAQCFDCYDHTSYTCAATYRKTACYSVAAPAQASCAGGYVDTTANSYNYCDDDASLDSGTCTHDGQVLCREGWTGVDGGAETGEKCNAAETACSVIDPAFNCRPCSKGIIRNAALDQAQNSNVCKWN
jgi:hypothetical protein